jgi:hypothetical protein
MNLIKVLSLTQMKIVFDGDECLAGTQSRWKASIIFSDKFLTVLDRFYIQIACTSYFAAILSDQACTTANRRQRACAPFLRRIRRHV